MYLLFMIDSFAITCGYVATFMGTMLEGEISLLTSVLGAQMGYFNFYGAMAAGFAGAWVADWFKYVVGKTKGQKILYKKPKLQAKVDKYSQWFDKYPFLILTIYKFLFGFTTVLLIMAGLKNISYARFALHSAISVGLWTVVLGGLGYFYANAMVRNIQFVSMHSLEVIGVLALIAAGYWFFVKRPYRKECLECVKEKELAT